LSPLKSRFIELFKASRLSQAELARRMKWTRGGVNGVVKQNQEPSEAAVKLLEMILMDSGVPLAPGQLRESEVQYQSELERLREHGALIPARFSPIRANSCDSWAQSALRGQTRPRKINAKIL
jgi:transcriptional regulator with XRE-family HTH domain